MDVPKPLNKRQQQALQSRNKIYQSAVDLFQKHGYDNVTVENICKKANVSNGLFYNYFSSKNQILVEILRNLDPYYDAAFEAIPSNLNVLDKLIHYCSSLPICNQSLTKDFTRVLLRDFMSQEGHEVFNVNEDRPIYNHLETLIKEGQQNGQITQNLDSKEIRFIITHCLRGVLYQWALYDGGFDLKSEMEKVISTLIYGLYIGPKQ